MATPVIDGYSELDEIGQGGFATVYRARQDRLDRQVALKVLRAKNLDEATVRRFERECHAMGDLSWHPNVVGVFDSGVTADGHPWLTMEYMARGSIADRVRHQGPLPWAEAVDIGVQTAGALGAVHAAGRIHRDVKPENLLVGPFGEVKLADFGIAVVSDATSATAAQFTPGFVSAEVLQGASPDERSDVYSLGATLHALMAGHSPFATVQGEPVAALLMRAVQGERPRLDGIPDDLADLIVACLDTNPDARPQSAAALGEALQAVQEANGLPMTVLRITAERDAAPTDSVAMPALGDSSATIVGGPSESGDDSATVIGDLADTGDANTTIVGGLAGTGDSGDANATIMGDRASAAPVEPPVAPPPSAPTAAAPTTPPAPAAVAGKKKRSALLIGAGIAVVLVIIGVVGAVMLGGGNDGGSGSSSSSGSGSGSGGDGADGGIQATIPVGDDVLGLAADGDDLWVANSADNTVVRVPEGSDTVADTVAVGEGPEFVAVSGDDVWVTNKQDDTVSRVSASTAEVVETITVGSHPGDVAAAGDDVWVVNEQGNSVSRIDAPSGSVTTIEIGTAPLSIAVSADGAWVGTLDNDLVQIDPATNEVVQTISLGGDSSIEGVAVTTSDVWAVSPLDATVSRVDPASGDVVGTVTLDGLPTRLATSGDDVYVTNLTNKVVQRIRNDEIFEEYDAGELPEQIAVSDSGVMFVSDRNQGAVLRVEANDP